MSEMGINVFTVGLTKTLLLTTVSLNQKEGKHSLQIALLPAVLATKLKGAATGSRG